MYVVCERILCGCWVDCRFFVVVKDVNKLKKHRKTEKLEKKEFVLMIFSCCKGCFYYKNGVI